MLEIHAKPTPKPAGPSQIEAEAEGRLRRSSSCALREVSCEFRDGVLVLRGRLPSFHHKQMAQELVHRIPGVERVDNQIEVSAADTSTWLG